MHTRGYTNKLGYCREKQRVSYDAFRL